MNGPDTFEVGDIGCRAFTGRLPPGHPGAPSEPWPATEAEASDRPVYGIMDLKKVDGGAIDFGPVGIVFNRARLGTRAILMPADTGEWSGSCNLTNQGLRCPGHPNATSCTADLRCRWAAARGLGRGPGTASPAGRCISAAENCCISKVGGAARAAGCDHCGDTPACCQDDKSYECAVWDGTPGVVDALDHVLLASAGLWNDTTAKRNYTPATNLADLLGRSVAAAGDYGARSPPLQPVRTPTRVP